MERVNGTELIVMRFVSAQKTTQVQPGLDHCKYSYPFSIIAMQSIIIIRDSVKICANTHNCTVNPMYTNYTIVILNTIFVYIIVSMHLLSFVQMLKWAYFEAIMNPILSDSFGFSLNTSCYVFLGVAISSILGSILV